MQNIAQVIVDGTLEADPVSYKNDNGDTVTTFTVMSNLTKELKASDEFLANRFPVECCWGRLAKNCNEYLRKGFSVTVQGELREGRWADEKGKEHSQIKILAWSVRFNKLP